VRRYVDRVWPSIDPARLVLRLLGDAAFLADVADGVLSPDEQALVLWRKPAKAPTSVRWSLADAVLVDEVADLVERTPSLGHVVADEAQDLSPMMLRAVGRRCSTGSTTVLGDLAQATTPWATRSWPEALAHLGKPDAHLEQLTLGFRVPGEVIEYAARLLPVIAPGLAPPTSVRRARGELSVTRAESSAFAGQVASAVGAAVRAVGSVGVIIPDALLATVVDTLTSAGLDHVVLGDHEGTEVEFDAKLDVVPASLAKGLEFDHVVLIDPAGVVAGEADRVTGLRRLYVCLTRAVTSLAIVHTSPLPDELGAP
jgi:DNA helicase IV